MLKDSRIVDILEQKFSKPGNLLYKWIAYETAQEAKCKGLTDDQESGITVKDAVAMTVRLKMTGRLKTRDQSDESK